MFRDVQRIPRIADPSVVDLCSRDIQFHFRGDCAGFHFLLVVKHCDADLGWAVPEQLSDAIAKRNPAVIHFIDKQNPLTCEPLLALVDPLEDHWALLGFVVVPVQNQTDREDWLLQVGFQNPRRDETAGPDGDNHVGIESTRAHFAGQHLDRVMNGVIGEIYFIQNTPPYISSGRRIAFIETAIMDPPGYDAIGKDKIQRSGPKHRGFLWA